MLKNWQNVVRCCSKQPKNLQYQIPNPSLCSTDSGLNFFCRNSTLNWPATLLPPSPLHGKTDRPELRCCCCCPLVGSRKTNNFPISSKVQLVSQTNLGSSVLLPKSWKNVLLFSQTTKNSTPAIIVVSNQNPSCRKSNQSSCLIPNRDRPGPENGQTIPKPEILAPKSKPEDCNKPKRHKVRFSSAPKYGVGTPHKVLMIIVEKVLILLIPDNNVSSMKIF